MGLSVQDQMLIEQKIANEKPSTGTAYILCLFLGSFGAHRFYLGRKGSGIAMLLLGITLFGLLISCPWAIVDLFLISFTALAHSRPPCRPALRPRALAWSNGPQKMSRQAGRGTERRESLRERR